MISLTITPEVTLADEPVKIQVCGLPPQRLITLRAWLKDERGEIFYSQAFYKSDNEGKIDLDCTPATGGDFQGVCPMGLLWALKPITPFQRLVKREVMETPFYVHVELYINVISQPTPHEDPLASKVVERWYVAPGIKRIKIKQGKVRGALFLPPGDGPFPGVIDIFGATGGLLEFRSSLLACRGFACLALAYFDYDDLPSFLGIVELEYYEEAIEVLLGNPKVLRDGVGVLAGCKGVEIALAMASYLPRVKATVCINGAITMTANSLRYGDIYMEGIPYHNERVLVSNTGAFQMTCTFPDPRKPEHEAYIPPLEKVKGPILFLVGEDDTLLDSVSCAKAAKDRAEAFGKKDISVLSFPGAGHLIEPPGSPLCTVTRSPYFTRPLLFGGELIPHCAAQETCWRELQDFFHINIAGPSRLSKL
uniref:Bile acid-CoA:amino acid N-acyltransferase n=1 Tax=Leptobrachium leishanense TaxID=445787 RepID=A0A8C5LZ58_9ANUR